MQNQETNTKPQGRPGPFPAFPFYLLLNVGIDTIGLISTLEIDHEFYIIQAESRSGGTTSPYNGLWIAPFGFSTPEQVVANGTPLARFNAKTTDSWWVIQREFQFFAGPFPKGSAIYYMYDNTGQQKEASPAGGGVVALDIYKDQNFPETRY